MIACQYNKYSKIKLTFCLYANWHPINESFQGLRASVCALAMSEAERAMIYFGKRTVKEKIV